MATILTRKGQVTMDALSEPGSHRAVRSDRRSLRPGLPARAPGRAEPRPTLVPDSRRHSQPTAPQLS